jgi:hypothetical protein
LIARKLDDDAADQGKDRIVVLDDEYRLSTRTRVSASRRVNDLRLREHREQPVQIAVRFRAF